MEGTSTGTSSPCGTVVHTFGPNVTLTMPGVPPVPYSVDVESDDT